MSVAFSALPFPIDSLEPYISSQAINLHHGKHHKAYVDNLNNLLNDGDTRILEQIILDNYQIDQKVFNNSAQVWNHSFFWNCLSSENLSIPSKIHSLIEKYYGTIDGFKLRFKESAMSLFGSGWIWLVADNHGLSIINTSNADTPIVFGKKPLLTLDIWEHSYYPDYQNRRVEYVDNFLGYLINWNFVERNCVDF